MVPPIPADAPIPLPLVAAPMVLEVGVDEDV
jgi:hypothetical protein